MYFPYPKPDVNRATLDEIAALEPRYGWFFDQIRQDVDEFSTSRRLSKALALSQATGQPLNDGQYPMYFTGDLDASFVLVHLNPKQKDGERETFLPVTTFEQYFDVHRNWGAKMYGAQGYRRFKSRFDAKQVRFIRPFGVIGFNPEKTEEATFQNLERVVDQKLQMELVPYGSDTFMASAFGTNVVKEHFHGLLRVISARHRKYVLFCGRVFGPLIREFITDTHRFNLIRRDKGRELASSEFANLSIPFEGQVIRAGWCPSWSRQGLPMESYANEVLARFDDGLTESKA